MMLFKQLSAYPLSITHLPDDETIARALEQAAFVPCTGLESMRSGFAHIHGLEHDFILSAGESVALSLKKEEKVLPAAVVRDFLDERISQIEQEEGRSVYRKEKNELKQNIIDELLPKAFKFSSRTEAIIDRKNGFLWVNSAANTKAEKLLSSLREALGSLEVRRLHTAKTPTELMSQWLKQGFAAGRFEIEDECELKSTDATKAVIRMSRQDLTAEEVLVHLNKGKEVTRLALSFDERIRFTLTADFTFTRVQFLEVEQEKSGEHLADTLAAEQLIMCETFGAMLLELIEHLDGLQAI